VQLRWIAVPCALAVAASLAGASAERAGAFGAANVLGQRAEHERISRAALQCGTENPPSPCFEGRSIYNLAGSGGYFGAVGAPDNLPARQFRGGPDWWHCDNADYFDTPGYPQSRAQATAKLQECWDFIRNIQNKGVPNNPFRSPTWGVVPRAQRLLSDKRDPGVNSFTSCTYDGSAGRAKCEVFEAWGYGLHAAEDFYSHSNWADNSDPQKPVSVNNPPGLNRRATFMDTRHPFSLPDPRLATGCYPSKSCAGRIRHDEDLNKDKGNIININSVTTIDPITPRGRIWNAGTNFQRAVEGAVDEVRSQWEQLRIALVQEYKAGPAAKIICRMWRDTARSCDAASLAVATATDADAVQAAGKLLRGAGPEALLSTQAFDGDGHARVDSSGLRDGRLSTRDPNAGDGGAADALRAAIGRADGQLAADQRAHHDDARPEPADIQDPMPIDLADLPEEESPELGTEPPPPAPQPPVPRIPDPTRQGAVVITDGAHLGDVGDLVDVVRRAGRRGMHVSVGLVGEGWAPEALVRAVQASGGSAIAVPDAGNDLASSLQSDGLALQSDAMGDAWNAILAPGVLPVENVTGGHDRFQLPDAGKDEDLVVTARDEPVRVRLHDPEHLTDARATAEPGHPAVFHLRDQGAYEVHVQGPDGRQFEAGVHHR
jgi:hypothetical protein